MSAVSPAVAEALAAAGVTHRIHCHDALGRQVRGPQDVAEALGIDIARISKTLLVSTSDGRLVLVVAPVARRLRWPVLAAACGARRVALASASQLRDVLGQLPGGVSPLGAPAGIPVLVDDDLLAAATVLVGAGIAGVEVELDPKDLVTTTSAQRVQLEEEGAVR